MLLKDDNTLARMNGDQISKCGRGEPVRYVKQDGKGMGFHELVETLLCDTVGSQPRMPLPNPPRGVFEGRGSASRQTSAR